MTAQPHDGPHAPLLPAPEQTPRAVRAALLPEDVPSFDREFHAAMATAAETFDLTPVTACVHRWWQVAWSSADPAGERATRQRAERLMAGEHVPTVPWEQAKTRLGL